MAAGIFGQSLRSIAAAALAATVAVAGAALVVMDGLYGDANAKALGEAARSLAAALPDEALPALAPEAAGGGYAEPETSGSAAAPYAAGGRGAVTDASGSAAPPSGSARLEAARAAAARFAARTAGGSSFRVTLIALDGGVAADSKADPAAMENHSSRPEVEAALRGGVGTARRRSATIGMELFYAAAPVLRDGRVAGALRVAADLPALESRLGPARLALAAAALLAGLVSLAAAAYYSRRASRPIARLAEAAKAYAAGPAAAVLARPEAAAEAAIGRSAGPAAASHEAAATEVAAQDQPAAAALGAPEGRPLASSFRVREGPEEIRVLGRCLEAMAAELAARVAEAEAEGRERRAILDGMAEALLSLDGRLRVRLANPAAAALFGLGSPAEAVGKSLLEASRSTELEAAAREALASGSRLEAEIALYSGGERWFQAVAAPFPKPGASPAPGGREESGPGGAGAAEGLILVLSDITRLRRLERIRRDFVANVSHELRTPVQLVKGFAENLRGGSLADPEKADRFLAIIERNAARMENLIDDLLVLARLEQEGQGGLPREDTELAPLLEAAREAVLPRAEAKGIAIRLDCAEGLKAGLNGGLVEQAVVNLLDNAVKYSPAGKSVELRARSEAGGPASDRLRIEVRDRGIGIPAKDLPRVFERFYRVDKARSREQGGTGLGLAIVRHVALAHGGSVSVESWEGEGSLFTILIPLGGAAAGKGA